MILHRPTQTSLATVLKAFLFGAALLAEGCSSSGAGSANGGAGTGASAGGGHGGGGAANSAGSSGQAGSVNSSGGASSAGGANGSAGNGGQSGSSSGSGGAAGLGGAAVGGAGQGGTAGVGGGASGSGGAGQAGSAGSSAYHPCPTDGSACKVLPLGDSITYGVNDEGNGGYRGPLFASAVAARRKITFTGSLSNGPTTVSGQTFPRKNEGHSGWGISEVTPYSGGNAGIATVIPTPAFSANSGGMPNIILLHIGTNDATNFSAAQMTADLSGFLDKIITNAPDAYLVVAQIIPLGYGDNANIKTYNQSIPGLVQQRANAGKHIALVDMFTGFTPSSMLGSDNIHPNSAGYKFMADHWYSAIGPLLPQ
jgi:lysophospholipase L1-like esterase